MSPVIEKIKSHLHNDYSTMCLKVKFATILSVLIMSLFFLNYLHAEANARTIVFPDDFSSIQAAINNASAGDTILVHNGTYYETLVVNKSVSLMGDGRQATIIDGNGSGTVVKVTSENVVITGFTIRNGGSEPDDCGLLIESNHCYIMNNTVSENGLTGIYLNRSSESFLIGNMVTNNSGDAVVLFYSSNNTCISNIITHNNIGFWLVSSIRNNVSNNTLEENRMGGINLMFSSVNKLEGNIIINNNNYGIVVDYSSENNSLVGNSVTRNNGTGIMLGSAPGSQLRNNTMAGNKYNFHKVLSSPSLQEYIVDVDISNTVNGKPIYYLINKSNIEINSLTTPNLGYLALVNSTNITVRNLNLNQNGQGLLLAFSAECNLINLNVTNNNFGIQLCSSNKTLISYCHIANNTMDGVTLDYYSTDDKISGNSIISNKIGIRVVHSGTRNNTIAGNRIISNGKGIWIYSYSMNNTVVGNTITYNELGISIARYSDYTAILNNWIINNGLGLSIEYSSANSVYHNNFIENTVQVEAAVSINNTWDGGYPLGGNYWSDLACTDLLSGLHQNASGSDGVCDFHYVIDDDNQDRYPLAGLLNCFLYQASNRRMLEIHVVSNSTISSFNINATHITISFNVSGETGIGFCRVTVPNIIVEEFWQSDYIVLVDEKSPLDLRSWKDSENTYVYFTYPHPEHRVVIVSEWSSLILVAFLLILTTITVTIVRRKTSVLSKTGPPGI